MRLAHLLWFTAAAITLLLATDPAGALVAATYVVQAAGAAAIPVGLWLLATREMS